MSDTIASSFLTHRRMQLIPWLNVGWQLQMREIDNSVRWEMIFVLIVWPGHSRPVIKIHYLAPCSVVQADFREKIDSPDLDYNFADVQIWVRQHVAFLSLVAFFFFSPSIAVQVPAAPVQLAVLPDSAMADLARAARHNFLLVTQLPCEQGCAGITVSMLRHGIMTHHSHKRTRGRSLRAESSLALQTTRMSCS